MQDRNPNSAGNADDMLTRWRRTLPSSTAANTTVSMTRLTNAHERDTGDEMHIPLPEEFPPGYPAQHMLGAGGMAAVFEGRQRSLERTVALKVLGHPDHPARKAAFQREAVLSGRLSHPAIPPVHDLVENEDGRPFLVMKKVEGHTWASVIRETSLEENLDILMRVADGVAFAHAQGVIHRDIKPDNVTLGHFGEVFLMDWGLALPQLPSGGFIEMVGSLAGSGTPAYMAPEMALGIGPDIGFQTDVYLLGATLFEIVVGKPPHPGSNATRALLNAAENHIRKTKVSHECLDIALRAMALEPSDRMASVREFQDAVRTYREHAQSFALNAVGEDHLAAALRPGGGYEEFAEAQSSFKQALHLWSDNRTAADNLRKARLANARQAFAGGDLELAASQLVADDREQRELLEAIQRERARLKKRHRQFKRLQQGLIALLGMIAVVLLASTVWIGYERNRAEVALHELQSEQRRREADRRQSAPALTITAKRLISYGDIEEARVAATAAMEFDPTLIDAHYVRIALRLLDRDFSAAARAAAELLERAPEERDAAELLRISREAATGDPEDIPPTLLARITPILGRKGMPAIGSEFALSDAERLDIWKRQLLAAWPEFDPSRLHLRWVSSKGIHVSFPRDVIVEDLSPLTGIPVVSLNLTAQRALTDLTPLRGMPLRELSLMACNQITDLTPLSELPLEDLNLQNADRIEDLSPLRNLPIKKLVLSGLDRISSLEPLRDMPLEHLEIYGLDQINNLDVLEGKRLRFLSLSSTGVSDIRTLAGMPIETLYLRGLTLDGFEPLRGMPLEELHLENTNFRDLELLAGMRLENLNLKDLGLTDISTLRGMPLETLRIDAVGDLSPLRGMPLRNLSLGDLNAQDPPLHLQLLHTLPLESLTIKGWALTRDLSWLDGISLNRLTIDLVPWRDNPMLDFSHLRNAEIKTLLFPDHAEVDSLASLLDIEGLQAVGHPGQDPVPPETFLETFSQP